ncbi:MAG TPA: PaaI family thioesterase [Mycobacteriales bacterium]|nr:PaaI family thioesterase [Mycobacteriales bacterium]
MGEQISPGQRFLDGDVWANAPRDSPHIWNTLGYRRTMWEPGTTTIEWQAAEDYCFPTADGPVVQGGLVTALLDAAMGGACWTVLDRDQVFLTADLRVEFLRMSRPGSLRATGSVVRRTQRVVFCSAELLDSSDHLLATSRCTQIVLPGAGPAGRSGPADRTGAPPDDARG